MLVNLHVKNFALIDEADIEFEPGLNILTGETGAGKSILLGSVQLALGQKMSKDLIRENAEYALVELLFRIEDTKTVQALKEMELFPEDGEVLISRRVTEKKSICRINGMSSTVQEVKKAAGYLLDIHGQHEHQSLLQPSRQLQIIDEYGKEEIGFHREKVKKAYQTHKAIRSAIDAMQMDDIQKERELDLLQYQLGEIQQVNFLEGEDAELERSYKRLSNSKHIVAGLEMVYDSCGYDTPSAAGEQIGRCIRELRQISGYDPAILELEQSLLEIDAMLNDFNREVSAYTDSFSYAPEEYEQIEERLNTINALKAKYGAGYEEVRQFEAAQQQRLQDLENYEIAYQDLLKQEKEAVTELKACSQVLSDSRKKSAAAFEQELKEHLKDLNFLNVEFSIKFEITGKFSENGSDSVEYRISMNPGEPQKALSQVASGGELSRIMLAIKTMLADKDEIDTLIFDEIDAGISGRTAQKVAEKMHIIAQAHQVLCITHLPQIAAMADTHFEITKELTKEEATVTRISRLSKQNSIDELARLLGGSGITETVQANAREMKQLAEEVKNKQKDHGGKKV
ncbi:MAG: DNA repair protein RecN [Lachnospiraceae bacterium]